MIKVTSVQKSTRKNAREEVCSLLPQAFAASNEKARDETDILSLHFQSGEF